MITVDIEAMSVRRKRTLTATITGKVEDVWELIQALQDTGWVVLHRVVET